MHFHSQFAFSPTTLFYHKNFGIKTGQIIKNKTIRLACNIHWTEHRTKKETHETYSIKETIETLHNRYKIKIYLKLLDN